MEVMRCWRLVRAPKRQRLSRWLVLLVQGHALNACSSWHDTAFHGCCAYNVMSRSVPDIRELSDFKNIR